MTFARRLSGLAIVACVGAGALSACAPLFFGGVAGASIAAADRRSVGTQIEDQRIQALGTQRVKEVLDGSDTAYAYVTSYNRRVLLTGLDHLLIVMAKNIRKFPGKNLVIGAIAHLVERHLEQFFILPIDQ